MLAKKPQVIIVSGHPGSGRSVLANGIAKKLGWPVFSVGTVLAAGGAAVTREVATNIVLGLVEQAVNNDNRVVVDLAQNLKPIWEKFDDIKFRLPGVKFLPLFLLSDFDSCEKRVEEKTTGRDEAYSRVRLLTEFELCADFDFRGLVKMEARRPTADLLKNAVALIYANLMN